MNNKSSRISSIQKLRLRHTLRSLLKDTQTRNFYCVWSGPWDLSYTVCSSESIYNFISVLRKLLEGRKEGAQCLCEVEGLASSGGCSGSGTGALGKVSALSSGARAWTGIRGPLDEPPLAFLFHHRFLSIRSPVPGRALSQTLVLPGSMNCSHILPPWHTSLTPLLALNPLWISGKYGCYISLVGYFPFAVHLSGLREPLEYLRILGKGSISIP